MRYEFSSGKIKVDRELDNDAQADVLAREFARKIIENVELSDYVEWKPAIAITVKITCDGEERVLEIAFAEDHEK